LRAYLKKRFIPLADSISELRKIRVAIVVHGRFHAFDLARALQKRTDVEVMLLTNYSANDCQKFGVDPNTVSSFVLHRYAQAFFYRLIPWFFPGFVQRILHQSFGRWALKVLLQQKALPDVIRVFSGVAEEILAARALDGCKRIVTRGSSHIRVQQQILQEESKRAGVAMDMPSDWMLAREMREYAQADAVVVLSKFAADTFLQQGFEQHKLLLIPNSVNLDWYRVSADAMQARKQRISANKKLRVLMVGSFLFRKGIIEFAELAAYFKSTMEFRFVGDMPEEGLAIKHRLQSFVEFHTRVPPQELSKHYAWGDVFLFPTIEDGFPAVLAQAMAAGLGVITTCNGSGPDLIESGQNGWVLNARDKDAMIEKLQFFDENRSALAEFCDRAVDSIAARSWDHVADDFVTAVRSL
jgi:glycosyltransferase involved in cell wall biosynthesis